MCLLHYNNPDAPECIGSRLQHWANWAESKAMLSQGWVESHVESHFPVVPSPDSGCVAVDLSSPEACLLATQLGHVDSHEHRHGHRAGNRHDDVPPVPGKGWRRGQA